MAKIYRIIFHPNGLLCDWCMGCHKKIFEIDTPFGSKFANICEDCIEKEHIDIENKEDYLG